MIIKASEANKKIVGAMRISEYKINKDFSCALIRIKGTHGKVRCIKEDRIYFIFEGKGFFIVNGKKQAVSAEDVVFIPKNTPYDIKGDLKFFLVCSPEFKPEDDEFLE